MGDVFDTSAKGLQRLISRGETDRVEFKSRLVDERVLAKHLAAFANGAGGVLIIGVRDRGEIVGLAEDELDRTLERLTRLARDLMLPVKVGHERLEEADVVYAVVQAVATGIDGEDIDGRRLIVRDDEILGGTPVFRGTRVPASTLIDYLVSGAKRWSG